MYDAKCPSIQRPSYHAIKTLIYCSPFRFAYEDSVLKIEYFDVVEEPPRVQRDVGAAQNGVGNL